MDSGYKKAEAILEENIDKLHRVANYLIENETMEAEQFEEVMKDGKPYSDPSKSEQDHPEIPS